MIGRKKKQQDKRIWQRMGRELAALRDMIGYIIVDPEYQAVMDRKTWGRLGYAQTRIDELRSEAENRMAQFIPGWNTEVFYPHDRRDLEAAINEFRNKMKEPLEPNAPLTLDELWEMKLEPVWVQRSNGVSRYYIADSVGTGLDLYCGGCGYEGFADYGKTWLAYRRNPKGGTPQ